jgi:hypothetical protein
MSEQWLGLITGICFGALLQQGRVLRFEKQVGAMLLEDMTILKFMLSAILGGMAAGAMSAAVDVAGGGGGAWLGWVAHRGRLPWLLSSRSSALISMRTGWPGSMVTLAFSPNCALAAASKIEECNPGLVYWE